MKTYFLVALALVGCSTAQAQDADLGWWNAFNAIGDGTGDAILVRTDRARVVMHSFALDFRVDTQTADLMGEVRDAALELDLGRLYEMLPEPNGETRQLRLYAECESDTAYTYTLFPEESDVCDGQLMTFEGLTSFRPVEHNLSRGDGFAVHQQLDMGTGPWTHRDIATLFEAFLVEIERTANTKASTTALSLARLHQPQLNTATDFRMVAAVEQALPNLSQTLTSAVVIDRVASIEDDRLAVDLVGRFDLAGLTAMGYPSLAKYLKNLGKLLVVDASIRDENGLPIMVMGAWTAGPGMRVNFTTADGALLPMRKGVPEPALAVRPTERRVKLTLRVDAEIRAEGMLIRVTDYNIPIYYSSAAGGADVVANISDEPRMEFTGQGRITSWIADIADAALNLESHGQVIFKAMAQGVDGTGT
ncbi:MAG: hypothetical protein GWP91_14655, partial [Rhodobacterales bacterium]|nr:hypothetical protein [Rhodobacterales bacterium]